LVKLGVDVDGKLILKLFLDKCGMSADLDSSGSG